jgi:hypothetical protein
MAMIKKQDRIIWLINNQNKWEGIPDIFPRGQKLIQLRVVASAMIDDKLYKPQPLATLEVRVLNLIKQTKAHMRKAGI